MFPTAPLKRAIAPPVARLVVPEDSSVTGIVKMLVRVCCTSILCYYEIKIAALCSCEDKMKKKDSTYFNVGYRKLYRTPEVVQRNKSNCFFWSYVGSVKITIAYTHN